MFAGTRPPSVTRLRLFCAELEHRGRTGPDWEPLSAPVRWTEAGRDVRRLRAAEAASGGGLREGKVAGLCERKCSCLGQRRGFNEAKPEPDEPEPVLRNLTEVLTKFLSFSAAWFL